jgi:tRNA-splicing endonuclease subunit Sen34
MEDKKSRIKLSLINGRVLTFNANDYMEIRTEHRIVGKLIGIPVTSTKNVVVNALPAIFTDYQVKLLLEKGIVDLEDKVGLKNPPTDDVKEGYQRHKESIVEELEKPYIESRLKVTRTHMEEIIAGKVKKLLKSGVPEKGEGGCSTLINSIN